MNAQCDQALRRQLRQFAVEASRRLRLLQADQLQPFVDDSTRGAACESESAAQAEQARSRANKPLASAQEMLSSMGLSAAASVGEAGRAARTIQSGGRVGVTDTRYGALIDTYLQSLYLKVS